MTFIKNLEYWTQGRLKKFKLYILKFSCSAKLCNVNYIYGRPKRDHAKFFMKLLKIFQKMCLIGKFFTEFEIEEGLEHLKAPRLRP